ncbi:MAG: hypothetical protein RIB93_04215 [Coleofasciculus sp. D1-CHI-01]
MVYPYFYRGWVGCDRGSGLEFMRHLSKGRPDTIEWMGSVH